VEGRVAEGEDAAVMAPVDPKKPASPNVKMPPSSATIQYPPPERVAAMPTIGLARGTLPSEPANGASPNV
jgi:hypothetical protein